MRIRAIEISKKFIPEWNGNKELTPGDQLVIFFNRIPGTSEKSKFKDFKFDQSGGIQLVYNDQLMISTFVERVENLELEKGGKIEKVKNGIDLANANQSELDKLFSEIRNYLFPEAEEFEEGESKA